MKLIFLGTGGYRPNDRRQTMSIVLPEIGVVLDAGTGLYRAGPHLQTDALDIFLSHAHLDHVFGLTTLFDVLHRHPLQRVTVHGEAAKLAAVNENLFHEMLFPVGPPFETSPLTGPFKLPGDGQLTHFPLEHPGGSIGFRLDWPDRSLAYVTDTTAAPGKPYIEAIRGVDVLIHECHMADGKERFAELTGHSCTTPVAKVAAAAGVKRLLLTHFNPLNDTDDPININAARKYVPDVTIAEDNLEIEF